MEIKTKFNLGESVYYDESYSKQMTVSTCDLCGGTGRLSLVVGGDVCCTKCRGYGGNKKSISLYRPVKNASKIGKISTEFYDKKYDNEKNRVYYMLEATGVGSGIMHKEEAVFGTIKECQVYCEALNEKAIKDFNEENNIE